MRKRLMATCAVLSSLSWSIAAMAAPELGDDMVQLGSTPLPEHYIETGPPVGAASQALTHQPAAAHDAPARPVAMDVSDHVQKPDNAKADVHLPEVTAQAGAQGTPVDQGNPDAALVGDSKASKAFIYALNHMMPSADEVRHVKAAQYNQAVVQNAPYGPKATPVTRSLTVSLRPGEQPPVLHLAYGAVTTLTFADVTGAPWNVTSVVGDNASFGLSEVDKKATSNIITIYPKLIAGSGRNLVITLEGASLPVIFDLQTGSSKTVDYRVDVSLRQRGPHAKTSFIEDNLAPTDDVAMQQFVDGIPPDKAHKLKTSDPAVDAWRYNHMVYVRTSLEVMSPRPIRRATSGASGINVFAMTEAPDILLSQDGRIISVMIGR